MARLLWLDDRVDERRTEIEALSRLGYQVHTASSEADAVRILERDALPDLVIQDLHRKPSTAQVAALPARAKASAAHASGWAFYRDVLRAGFPQVPVIIFTIDASVAENKDLANDFNLVLLRKTRANLPTLIEAVRTTLAAQRTVLISRPLPPAVVQLDFDRVNTALVRHLAQHPVDLHKVSWSAFEELVATLLREMRYEVWRTPLTRDGGVDIWALHRSDLGDVLYAIDAKKYSPERVLGPDPVRAIYGVAEAERANVGMIVTTATFGPAAKAFAEQLRYRVSLRDYADVVKWIGAVERGTAT
jgi:CheY-like chemotaxis protein